MIDAVVKIIDRFIDLAKRREQTNRNLFTDFVAPAFADFESVHKDYLDSIRQYREKIKTSNNFKQLEKDIVNQINEDTLFSKSIRAKLFELERWETDDKIGDFVSSILKYIYFGARWGNRLKYTGRLPNTPRSILKDSLIIVFHNYLIPTKTKKKRALDTLDEILNDIQSNYSQVVNEFNTLKDKLLRGI